MRPAVGSLPLLLLFILVTACATPLSTEQPVARHVILISIDGLRPEFYLDSGYPAPILRKLAASGARAQTVEPVFPSNTNPNHATILTGLRPNRHGILFNVHFEPDGTRGGWYEDASELRAPSLWMWARTAGLRTASLNWPTTHFAQIDLLVTGGDYPANEGVGQARAGDDHRSLRPRPGDALGGGPQGRRHVGRAHGRDGGGARAPRAAASAAPAPRSDRPLPAPARARRRRGEARGGTRGRAPRLDPGGGERRGAFEPDGRGGDGRSRIFECPSGSVPQLPARASRTARLPEARSDVARDGARGGWIRRRLRQSARGREGHPGRRVGPARGRRRPLRHRAESRARRPRRHGRRGLRPRCGFRLRDGRCVQSRAQPARSGRAARIPSLASGDGHRVRRRRRGRSRRGDAAGHATHRRGADGGAPPGSARATRGWAHPDADPAMMTMAPRLAARPGVAHIQSSRGARAAP